MMKPGQVCSVSSVSDGFFMEFTRWSHSHAHTCRPCTHFEPWTLNLEPWSQWLRCQVPVWRARPYLLCYFFTIVQSRRECDYLINSSDREDGSWPTSIVKYLHVVSHGNKFVTHTHTHTQTHTHTHTHTYAHTCTDTHTCTHVHCTVQVCPMWLLWQQTTSHIIWHCLACWWCNPRQDVMQ